MPACLTHYLFAQSVLNSLPEKDTLDKTAYFWGAQGPDFLFCHRHFSREKGKSLKPYGNKLHKEKPSLTLGAMRDFLKRHGDISYRSYVLGLLCHYSLDSTAHPYINALADKLVEERPHENRTTMHGEIEAALDAVMLRRETGKLPSEVPLGKMFPKNEPVQRRIAKLYRDVILQVFGEDVPDEELLRATNDAHFVFSLLTDRTGLKLRAFNLLEKGRPSWVSSHIVPITERDDVDYANVSHKPWSSAEGESERDFFELFEEAQALAGSLIANFESGNLSALTRERPFG